jgi:AraC-like DNA-binding protein
LGRRETTLAGHDSAGRDVGQRVRQVIDGLLTGGDDAPSLQAVADRLGTSVRTLQRRLQAAGTTYADVVQETRCAAARQLLRDRGRRICEVARALGYADPAHFTRAFQRWTGLSPRDFRRRR